MDAFDIGLKATALEGEIKGWEKRKDHLFSPLSFFFFFLNQQRERRHHGNAKLLGRDAQRQRPCANHPSRIAQPLANPTARPSPLPALPARLAGESCSQGWDQPLSRLLGAEEEAEEEGKPVNKPRLNRLLGAVQAEPMPSLILKSGAIHQRRTGSFHGKLKRATLKGRGKNLSGEGRTKAWQVWYGEGCCPRQAVIHCRAAPCHCQGGCGVQATKCPLDGGGTAGMGTLWVLSGMGDNAGITEGKLLWFAPQRGKVPTGGANVTKPGSSWMSGEEVVSGTAMGHTSPGPPQLLSPVTELPPQ